MKKVNILSVSQKIINVVVELGFLVNHVTVDLERKRDTSN